MRVSNVISPNVSDLCSFFWFVQLYQIDSGLSFIWRDICAFSAYRPPGGNCNKSACGIVQLLFNSIKPVIVRRIYCIGLLLEKGKGNKKIPTGLTRVNWEAVNNSYETSHRSLLSFPWRAMLQKLLRYALSGKGCERRGTITPHVYKCQTGNCIFPLSNERKEKASVKQFWKSVVWWVLFSAGATEVWGAHFPVAI